tara:strand:+ start:9151 stop:11445 length:2295 start_codon:yes stop_codon:yes gene_type:complete
MATYKNKKVDRIRNLYNKLNTEHRDQWLSINQKGYDFSNDNQLSDNEKQMLEESGMPTFTINRITPVVEMLNYYATANQPRWQAIGVDGSDSNVATVFSDIADYIWYTSNGQTLFSNAVNDAITKSIGYILVTVDQNMDQGMGEVVLHNPDPFDVYIDPKSRDMLFKDAAYIMIRKMLPKTHLKQLFPDLARKINKISTQYQSERSLTAKATDRDQKDILQSDIDYSIDNEGKDDPLIDYIETYEKVKIPYVNVFYRSPLTEEQLKEASKRVEIQLAEMQKQMQVEFAEQQKQMQAAVQSGQMMEERYKLETEKAQTMMQNQLQSAAVEFTSKIQEKMSKVENKVVSKKEYAILSKDELFSKNIIDAVEFYDNRIKLTGIAGDQFLYEKILPERIKDYPIIPIHYKWIGTPYPISAVSPLVGKQQELNKSHQLMVHNASLGSSLRYMYYEGSIDADIWEQYSSSPGALLPVNHGYEPPKPIQPAQLSNAFFGIVNSGKSDMEYLAGIYSSMQGDAGATKDMPYRGMLAMDEYGTRRVKYWLKHSIEPSLKHMGHVVKQFSQSVYTAHKVFRIIQPSSLQEEKQVEINRPIYNDLGEAIGKFHDYSAAKFDIRIVAGSTMPINRWAYLEELKQLLGAGVIDRQAVLAETDIRNKESIQERIGEVQQLQSQIQQLQDTIKDKEGTIETLERQVVQSGIRDKVRQAEMDINAQKTNFKSKAQKEFFETQAQQKLLRNNLSNDAYHKRKEIQELLKSFQNDLETKDNT